ncbi:MAG: hypothetical protein GTO40_03645, partial [Deltaproteobacteria bacterium]|nr:hypothetical protein [Deltaproteobacteria bacterium]
RLAEKDRSSLEELPDLMIPTRSGEGVPLRSLVRLEEMLGPMEIHRLNQERRVTVTGEVVGRPMEEVA